MNSLRFLAASVSGVDGHRLTRSQSPPAAGTAYIRLPAEVSEGIEPTLTMSLLMRGSHKAKASSSTCGWT